MKSIIILSLVILSVSASFNYQQCAKDAYAYSNTLRSYLKTIQTDFTNYQQILNQVQDLVSSSQDLLVNCPVPESTVQKIQTLSTGDCIGEIKDLTQLTEKALADYEAKNIFALVGDAQAIVKEARVVLADCKNESNQNQKLMASQPTSDECRAESLRFGQELINFQQIQSQQQKMITPEIISEVKNLYQEGVVLMNICGINSLDDGSVNVQVSVKCLTDITNLTTDVEKAISDYNSKNFVALIKDAQKIIVLANQTLSDCSTNQFEEIVEMALINNPKINYEKCAKDAYNFIKAAEQFVNDVNNGTASHNLPLIITDIENIVTSAQALVTDCGINNEYAQKFVQFDASNIQFEDTPACQKDIDSISLLAQQAIKDYLMKRQAAMVNDAALIIAAVEQSLKTNCNSHLNDNIEIALFNNPKINYEKCAVDAYHFGQACYNFIQDVQNGTDSHNLPQIITDISNIVTTAQALVTDCGINSTLATTFAGIDLEQLPQVSAQCLKDIDTLAVDVKKAITDYEAKNMIALVKDAEKVIVQANKTVNECKTSFLQEMVEFKQSQKLQSQIPLNIDLETCFANSNQYAAQFYALISAIPSTDFTQDEEVAYIQTHIEQIRATAQAMLDECGIQYEIPVQVQPTAGNCIGDVVQLGTLAVSAYNDIIKGNFKALAVALVGIVSEASSAINDCFASADVQNQFEGVLFACIHGLDTFTTLIEQFQADYQQGDDFVQLVQDSSNIAQYVPVLLNTCGVGKAAAFYTKYFPDECIQSLAQTADAGYKVYEVRNNFFNILRALPEVADALESDVHTCPLLKKL